MAIVLTRVDGRLIHGQVATVWTRNVGAEKILVIDDETANDEMQTMLLEMATPSGVSARVSGIEKGIELLKSGWAEKQKTMVIVKEPKTVLELLKQEISLNTVNIGGMYFEEGKKQLDKALFVDHQDLNVLKEIKEKGVELYYQVAPMNKKQDLFSLIN